MFFFVILVPITPNLPLWWHQKLRHAIIELVLFGLREAPGSAMLLHQTKHQSMLWADQQCWVVGLITRLCESSRQRHVDDLVNIYTDLKFGHLFYLLSDLDFIFTTMADLVWIRPLSSCDDFKSDWLLGMAGKKYYRQYIDMETWVPHARVTSLVFFFMVRVRGYLCLTQMGISVGTSCFDQNIIKMLCVDVFVDENVRVRSEQ